MTEPTIRTEYRVIERKDKELPPFAIYLATTNESGQVEGAHFPPAPEGGTLLELQANLRAMCQALDKPVLKLEELPLQAKPVTLADLGYGPDAPAYLRLSMADLRAVRDFMNEQFRENPHLPADWVERLKVAEMAHLAAEREKQEKPG